MTINQQFAIECGEIRLSVSARNDLETRTLYMLCMRGIQAVLNSELLEVEERQNDSRSESQSSRIARR